MATIQTRARNIVLKPAQEWSVIAGESAEIGALLWNYAAPLSAIGPVCLALWLSRFGFLSSLVSGVITWALGLVGLWLAAIVIEHLAPSFESHGTTIDALKLVVYASTPVWLAGVLFLVPVFSPLIVLAAIYAVYVFYLGLPPVMHTPKEK